MAWIESHTVLSRHRKTISMGLQLGIKPVKVVGHLHMLWHSVLEQAEDGDIGQWSDGFISAVSGWDGDPALFAKALRDNGWVDGGLVHDWIEYAGRYLEAKYRSSKPEILASIRAKYNKEQTHNRRKLDHSRTKDGPPNLPNITKPTKPHTEIVVPEWIDKQTWDDFCSMRKRIKKPLTEAAVKLTISQLEKLKAAGNDPKAVLEQSIQRAWQGVFAVAEPFNRATRKGFGEGDASRPVQGKYDSDVVIEDGVVVKGGKV